MNLNSKIGLTNESVASKCAVLSGADTRIGGAGQSGRPSNQKMRTHLFDQVSSLLMALIVLIGSMVAMMFVAWVLTSSQQIDLKPPVRITSVTFGSSQSVEQDFEEPAESEIESLVEPTLEQTVQHVTDLPSTVRAQFAIQGPNGDGEFKGTKASELSVGPAGSPDVPKYLRWELRFNARSEKEFAAQLDQLNIELGAFGGGEKGIDYVAAPFDKSSTRHSSDPEAEKRLYFSWNKPTPLQRYEQRLVQRAGIAYSGRQLVKFIPPELEISLADKELEYAQSHGFDSVAAIAKTVFQCRAVAGKYDFAVIDQRYRSDQQRSPPKTHKSR